MSVRVTAEVLAEWRARADGVTRWCLAELALTSTARAFLPRDTASLGRLLRLVLATAESTPAALLDDLATVEDGKDADGRAAARLGTALGGRYLLVVAQLDGGQVASATLHACATADEAMAQLRAVLGRAASVAALGRGQVVHAGLAGFVTVDAVRLPAVDDAAAVRAAAREDVLCLPLLDLDAPPALGVGEAPASAHVSTAAAAPAAPPAPIIFGGTMQAGAIFLDGAIPFAGAAVDVREAGAPVVDDARGAVPAIVPSTGSPRPRPAAAPASSTPAPAAPKPAPRRAAPPVEEEEEPETPIVDRAAIIARVRERESARADRVPATVASDDGELDHVWNAAVWLAEASLSELRALAGAGWTGDEAAELATTLAEDDPEIAEVVRYARRHDAELIVEIDGRTALGWLARHRPEVAAALTETD